MSQSKHHDSAQTYAPGTHPTLPPPVARSGAVQWLMENLFSSWFNTLLTAAACAALAWVLPSMLDWALFNATFEAASRNECREAGTGACWAFISERFDQFVYGFYPEPERWRPNLAFALLAVALAPVLFDKLPMRRHLLWFSLVYPVVAYVLLCGGILALPEVETHQFGGFLLTVVSTLR